MVNENKDLLVLAPSTRTFGSALAPKDQKDFNKKHINLSLILYLLGIHPPLNNAIHIGLGPAERLNHFPFLVAVEFTILFPALAHIGLVHLVKNVVQIHSGLARRVPIIIIHVHKRV